MKVLARLLEAKINKGGGFLLLLDPDRGRESDMYHLAESALDCGVDALLIGTSFMLNTNFHSVVKEVKARTKLPVIIFPGGHGQISPYADAILFTSLISGRNPNYLIEEQVKGAPIIKRFGLEPISTGYMLIESGRTTSVQYISDTRPIPANKPDIAAAHALAAQYFGMRMIFMEAGSGAERPVPEEMIKVVSEYIEIPIIVGGGLRHPEDVSKRIAAGASFVVVGDHFEKDGSLSLMQEFTEAAHPLKSNATVSVDSERD